MSLPLINISIIANIQAFPEDGNLLYDYKPFQNLKIEKTDGTTDLTSLSISAKLANINIDKPINLETEVSYDDSVNLIINDQVNPVKIVNSRFYLVDSNTYKIADRKGNLDTNIYTEENFDIESGFIKTVSSVIDLEFLGIFSGGTMKVGNYTFYFKLADSDGNETDFIAESGKVVCHIGAINQPSSIRGGLLDENSDKLIKFKLNNLDLAYDYINVYYTRNTGNDLVESAKSYKITDKFKINSQSTTIAITGYETYEEIDSSEINIQYTNFDAVKTVSNCQDITFAGGITKNYELFKTLEKYSLFVTPQLLTQNESAEIGNLGYDYTEKYPDENVGYEYYNANNIYYKLGYWNEDIYRFGIVYILNDYTLSPVFNIRGIQKLTMNSSFYNFSLEEDITYGEDYLLEKSPLENAKGVIKIESTNAVFNGEQSIKPIGLKFNFNGNVITGGDNKWLLGLKDLTKGFFIVRQKRIPTLLTQAVAIATANKSHTPLIQGRGIIPETTGSKYFTESFLNYVNSKPKLGRSIFEVPIADVSVNALLCPEAALKTATFSNFFNSSEYTLKLSNLYTRGYFSDSGLGDSKTMFNLGNVSTHPAIQLSSITSNLLLITPGIELINNNNIKFSSKAGDSIEVWKHLDPINGNLEDYRSLEDGQTVESEEEKWSNSISKIRGEYNTYIGCSSNNLSFGQYYNIFQKGYDFENKWKDYFKIRYNDSSPFMPVSDRISWDNISSVTPSVYRGDCYISTVTQRLNWNFIDPDFPTNQTIIDPWTWYKNYKVKVTKVKNVGGFIIDDTSDTYENITEDFTYKKVLDLFTYKTLTSKDDSEKLEVTDVDGLILPESRKYKKYSEMNGSFGVTKLNKPDINTIPIGHWVSYKICSNSNLAMRDVDFSRADEESIHKMKRSFYPLQTANPTNKLPESSVINVGISKSLGDKYYFEIPDVPFIKTNFFNRIYYSEILQESTFKNGNRIFLAKNYQDYTREYGAIVKLIEWYGKLICVMEHGVVLIPVNERAMMTNAQGENVYINTDTVLPKNPRVLSNTYGSVWEDAIVKTPRYIYGLDTIGKKVWRTNGETFELISDLKIQKFLNDNISLKIVDRKRVPGKYSIKAHYNAFKFDIMFVYTYEGVSWNLCWNELLGKWSTRYSWFPEYSENINNIFYTFANNSIHSNKGNVLYKHGFAGGIEESGNILPTNWYDTQHKFEFEFVVIGVQGINKVFDNLQIISNLAEPDSFYYEVVGESFEWKAYKNTLILLGDLNYIGLVGTTQMPARNVGESDSDYLSRRYQVYLLANTSIKKLPYIWIRPLDNSELNWPSGSETRDLTIEQQNKTKENLVSSYQKGLNFNSNGRLRGNMQYLEDLWDIQIQPIMFKWAYINSGVINFSPKTEMKIRDKYIKVRVQYSGTQYAIINAIKTIFTLSYA